MITYYVIASSLQCNKDKIGYSYKYVYVIDYVTFSTGLSSLPYESSLPTQNNVLLHGCQL